MSNQENIYLIEVGVEELPSSYIRNALNAFKDLVEKALNEENLGFDHIDARKTPGSSTATKTETSDPNA